MSIIIDCRGLACPEPVVKTNKALAQADEVTVIVDNDVARENVSRLAKSNGFASETETKEGLFYLHLKRQSAQPKESCDQSVSGPTILLIASDTFGRGSDELGRLLMRSFLHTLGEVSPLPQRVIFVNAGVKLVVEGSQVLDDLQALSEEGIDVLACGTCLGYYEIKDKVAVGRISNMYDIASALLSAGKVIEL